MSKPTRTTYTIAALAAAATFLLAGCSSDADTVSHNLSVDADNFKITRLITFHDDITDSFIAKVEGRCSLGNGDTGRHRTVTCKIGPDKYVKESFDMGDNTSVSSIQTEPSASDPYHYTVVFKPEAIIPNIETRTSK